jgi:iron complex outermembrane recepter protein
MIFRTSLFLLLFVAAAGAVAAQTSIRGVITSESTGRPLHGVTVHLSPLRRNVETDDNGVYEFTGVPPGRYTLFTHLEGFTDQTQNVVVSNAPLEADFSLSLTALREEVTVTATGEEQSVFDSFQSINSVGATAIREQASSSIGEVLEREAGVGKRSFGPGGSRPIIRGFDGDRVLVVEDGVRVGSLASQSADHGEPIDPINLERLEVLKGPATLLYGSNAIGGVVNAVTSDEDDPHKGVRGVFSGLGATNNRQGGASGAIEFGLDNFLIKGSGNFIREGDFNTPLGRIPNSASRAKGGAVGAGYFGKKGFFAGNFSLERRRYGVPYAPLFEEGVLLTDENGDPCQPEERQGSECQYDIFAIRDRFSRSLPEVPDEEIDIRMQRNNYKLRGGFRDVGGPIERGNFMVNFTRYRHFEIETDAAGIDETATSFLNNTTSYRGAFQQRKYKRLTGQFGFDGYSRNYLTEGAESLIDGRVRQKNFAVFGLEELDLGRVSLQFGGRFESNRYRPENTALYADRKFSGLSAAAGLRVGLWSGASFVTNFTSAYRSPAMEELYNEGPHIGTVTFEIGDQNLTRERSNGVEFSLRQRAGRLRLNGSFFYYRIDNFIFIEPQDEDNNGLVDVEDNLPVGRYVQDDARFVGADVSLDADLTKWLGLFVNADIVKAELGNNRGPLPRITPARLRFGFDLRHKGLSVRPDAVFTGAKKLNDVFSLETPTAGYALFGVNASYTVATEHFAHIFSVATSNLGDRLYRNHLSFIKDLAPEPGRNVRFSYTVRFF